MRIHIVALIAGITLAAPAHAAEVRYVVDTIIISVRTHANANAEVIRTIPSGTRMEVLEAEKDNSKVRLADGTVGWVSNQYVSPQPIARDRLAAALSRAEKLEAENAKLKTERDQFREQATRLDGDQSKLAQEHAKASAELDRIRTLAAKQIQLDTENKQLTDRLVALQSEHEIMRQRTQALQDKSDQEWFIKGAIIVMVSVMIGLIGPSLRRKKKSAWDSL